MSQKILIVDDEPHMLRVTELSLRKTGCEILTARNGREGVALAAQERPSLIVMDVVMPEMDGFEALRQLKASPETACIPVIMLTSRGQNVVREEAQATGAALYVTKPFSPSGLASEALRLMASL